MEAATFLLNEKRADIHALEARLKVSVVLIPNPNIETPNYEIERIKDDALSEIEVDTPSYRLVTTPAAEDPTPSGKDPESRPVRQQAAVQGITPEQPAPMPVAPAPVVADARPSLIGRIMGWFKAGKVEEEASPATPVRRNQQNKPAGDAESANRNQNRGDRKPRRDRPERQDRGERPDNRPPRNAEGGEARDSERGRQNRPPRPPRRPEQQQAETQTATPAIVAETPAENATPREPGEGRSKRGRRGGRRERGERQQGERSAQENLPFAPNGENGAHHSAPTAIAPQESVPAPSMMDAPRPPRIAESHVPEREQQPVEARQEFVPAQQAAPTRSEPQTQYAAPVQEVTNHASHDAPALQSEAHDENRPPRNPRRRRQFGGRHERPAASELVIVETDPNRTATQEPVVMVAAESARRERPPRRPRNNASPAEPLMQVETQKSDN